MKGLSFASLFRNPIFFILVIIIFTMMVAAGLRTSSGTVIPTSTVTAATVDPTAPPIPEPVAGHHSLRASLAAASAGFFTPMISATKTWMFAPGGDVNSNGLVDPGDTIMYTVTIANAAGATDALGVTFTDTIDSNTTLVSGSVVASPIAINDTYNTIGNVNISIPAAQGVINNDLNPNGSGTLTVTKVGATTILAGGTTVATTHGSVTMFPDGHFDYAPNAGFSGPSDSFTYTLDNGTGKTDTGTVTINVSGRIWFVNSAAGVNGDGRLNTPFNILTGAGSADSVDAANDVIFLYTSATNYTGGITLNNGELIIGQGASQSILTITGFTAPSGTNLLPPTGNATDPMITTAGTVAITLNSAGGSNGLFGFTVGDTGAAGTDIAGTTFGNLTVKDVSVKGTGRALNLMTGTIVSGSTFDLIETTGGDNNEGVRLNDVDGSFTATTTNIVNPTGTGIDVQSGTIAAGGFNFGGTTVNKGSTSGTGVNLSSNTGTISFSSLAVTTNSGTGVAASGGTVNVTTGSISATGGPALNVSAATTIGMTYTTVSSTNSTTTGINLTSASGSLGITTTSVTNSTGIGINVTSSSVTLNFGSTTANTSGGTGVVLGGSGVGNTGTITFGSLNIAPDANQRGLLATDNTNTITTTSGAISTSGATAVEITRSSSTTPLAVSLTSVSANGGSRGILLSNTSGSFTIAGSGTAGSGGTIQNMTGSDDSSATPVGTGIALNNVTNISLTRMAIHDHSNYGIRGTNVAGFTLDNSVLNGVNGTDAATSAGSPFKEGTIKIDNLSGSATISNTSVSGGISNNVRIDNTSATLNRITFTSDTIGSNSTNNGEDGILLETENSGTILATIQSTIFTSARGDLFNFVDNATSGTTDDLIFNNNTLSNNHPAIATGGGGTTISSNGTKDFTFHMQGNSFRDAVGIGILFVKSTGTASYSGTFTGNTIGVAATPNSGSAEGDAIKVQSAGQGTVTIAITNNQIHQYNNNGIELLTGGGATAQSGNLNAIITGNTIDSPGNTAGTLSIPKNGVHLNGGTVPGDTYSICAQIGGAGALANSLASSGADAVPPAGGGQDIRLRQRQSTTVRLPGYGGSATDDTAVQNFLIANNPSGGPSAIASHNSPPGGGFVGGAACTTPTTSFESPEDPLESITHETGRLATDNDSALQATYRKMKPNDSTQKLRQEELNWIVQAALERWKYANISQDDLARLQALHFEVANLSGAEISMATSSGIKIDDLAAGYGWFIDQSPWEDNEFTVGVSGKELQTTQYSAAHGKMDLLTVVMRELGREYLKSKELKDGVPEQLRPLMEGTLSPAVRRLIDASQIGFIILETPVWRAPAQPASEPSGTPSASQDIQASGAAQGSQNITRTPSPQLSDNLSNVALGTIPPGEQIVIMFQVKINDPFTSATPSVSNQGSVSGNFTTVQTDDPGVVGPANPTVTPINLPSVTVAVSPSSTPEDGAGNLVYTFTRTGTTTGPITVSFNVSGTATFNTDYTQTGAATFTASSGTVTIPTASLTATVTVDPTADTTVEPDETVILTVVSGVGYQAGVPAAATGTITNDDTDVSVAVSPSSVNEDGASNLVYTFTRAGVTTGALTVNFSVGGTATFNTDYTQSGAATFTASSGTVTFGAGNTTATVTVDPTADTTVEPNETVILTVTSGTGYNVGTPFAATGTITNDDTDVSVAVSPSSVNEDGATNLVYTFTRAGVTTGALTVNFSVGGTATFNTDYTQSGAATFTATTGTVTFAAVNSTATVTIDPTTDTTIEPDETVILTVTSGTGYNVGSPAAATGTITNDDTDVSVAVSPTSVAEDGATNLVYTFTRAGVTTGALTVNFSVGGTATFNTDYTQTGAATFTTTTGTVTIGAGNTTATVTIDPTSDSTVEPDETIILTVTSGTGYTVGSPVAATGTITNDDTDLSVAVSPSSVNEDGASNLVYTFTRNGVTTGALTVNFSVGGTATFNTDYTQSGAATFTASSGTVTMASGINTATVTVDPTADTTVEPDETVILTVTSGTGYNIGAPNPATGTITNDDADVSVAVSPASVAEDGPTNLVYTFTRSGATIGALTVNFSVGGTASFSTDYTQTGAATFTASTGTVTFSAGNSTATVTVDPTADATGEPDETVILTVTSGAGYNVGSPSAATGTILNDDTAVSVAVSPLSVVEDGASNLVYTFTRTGDTSTALTVNFSVGGTASFGTDYTQSGATTFTASSGTVTIGIGNASAMVTIDPAADSMVEPDETVILTVVAGSGYAPGPPNPATGTILNDDTDVSVAVSPTSTAEDGATNLVYTFTRTGVTTGAITVNFSVGGTATLNTDYTESGADTFTASSGTITIGAGNTTATVTIDPTSDTTVEPDETVILTVTSGTGYNVGSPSVATGTISNDDTDVTLAVSPSLVSEDGASNLVYTFTRSGVTTSSLTVNFSVGGTATFNTDYTQTGAATFTVSTGTVTFSAGNSTATVTVDPTADSTPEPDETVILTLTSGSGYNIGTPNTATGTIANDDTSITVAVAPSSVSEDGASNLVYTFTRTGVTAGSLTVNFLVSGTATFSTDYTASGADTFTASSGTLTFGAGITTATVTVDPAADSMVEPDETVVLMVAPGAGYNVGVPDTATGTIANDDTDVSVAVSPASVAEDGATNLVYTFTRSGVTTGAITVNFSVSGTATFNTDYTQTGAASFTASSGTVTIGAGNSTATVTVDPTSDTTVEPDETVILTVTSGTGYNIGSPSIATGTISNDDTDVTLAVSPSSVSEVGSTNLVYTFTRSGVTTNSLTVNFSVSGTATFTTDYTQTGAATFTASTGTITFTAGNATASVNLTPVNDALVEGNETAILTLTSGTGYNLGSPTAATGTITDNDTATLAFTAASANAPEQTSPFNVGVVLTINANGSGTPMLGRTITVNVQDLLTGSASGGGTDYTFSPNPQTVTFNSGDAAQTKTVSVTINNDNLSEGNETINFALNTLNDPTSGQVSLVSPTAETVTIVDNDIDLKVMKTESADPVAAGGGTGNLTYIVTVKNVGLTSASGVVLSEVLTIPSGVTVDSVTGSAGTTVTPIDSTHYTWTVGSLAVNATATLTATLTVGPAAMTGTNTICDTATITASNENRVNTGDDQATECTSIVAQADVEITSKSDAPDPVCVQGDITYTISFKNNGPGPALNAKVMDTVPANTTLVSASTASPGWGRTDAVAVGGTGTIVFMKGSAANGETATFTVVVKVNAGTLHGTLITNTASASSDLADPTAGNNSKQAQTTVDPVAPQISCPANVTGVTPLPGGSSAVVTYPSPTATDNCAGVTTSCVPPSGSSFPVGATTVTCTATDAAGNTASCTFTVSVFNGCLQDDTDPTTVLVFNTQTGDYRWCCHGSVFVGKGTVKQQGNTYTLSHVAADRRVNASLDGALMRGTASLQTPPGVTQCTITDRKISNDTCQCPAMP